MDFDIQYPSNRSTVMGRNAVATSQPLAAQAGLRMLLEGGNAVDAAIAAATALTVVEPNCNGIGSDLFAIVWDGSRLHGLNASGRSPAALTPSRFAGLETIPLRGWDSVTVPGAVSGWVALARRFATLPLEHLVSPAVSYARDGFQVSPTVARNWNSSVDTYSSFDGFAQGFLPQGRAPRPGERFSFPDQARTLELIAATEGEAFYRGELARAMAADAHRHGGLMTEQDLAEHAADWVGTMSVEYRGMELHEIPPSGQGIAALIGLGILRHHPLADAPVDSADSIHLQIEAMKLALADVYRYCADPDYMDVGATELLDDGYLAERAALIDSRIAAAPSYGLPKRGGTVYLTTADERGMMVSLIQSNYFGFGSGIVVPGTGISLQNRGAGFVLKAGHPNEVGGGKRPFHTIIPGFLTRDGAPQLSFGVMGGALQAQAHLQVIVRAIDYAQNPQSVADAPRWFISGGRDLDVEPGFAPEVLEELGRRGHRITQHAPRDYSLFGGAQLIWRTEDGYIAGSDHRKDGQAVAF
ncbi:MAG: Gamma-glutamyltransferase [Glaciihabitans sp.]|nr:Gamma-glutamyltransferase [Glaciihabitans sp.]